MLAKPLDQITFYDVYKAVDSVDKEEGLFHFHEQPNPNCPVGRNIHKAMDERLKEVQRSMENELKKITIADIAEDIRKEIRLESA